ncbi:DUF418 domain-containing protein [Acidobacteriia bacterium AH_259_A11_L15]|nr:DUF418 domain-containing protein [Acidobacteriia bacterium AH_259_A11_L15]
MPEQPTVTPVTTTSPPRVGPVHPKERIEVIDILRGFALYGVLLVNFKPGGLQFITQEWPGVFDQAVLWLVGFFAVGKFFRLFSFLFGLGFALQLGRAEARGVPFFPFYRRRLFVLLVFGLVNAVLFLAGGDILHIYAMLGFLLLLFRTCSTRTIIAAAVVCLLLPLVRDAAVTGIQALRQADSQAVERIAREQEQRAAEQKALKQRAQRTYSQGSHAEILAFNAQRVARSHSSSLRNAYLGLFGEEFVMFLLGFYAGRRRIFQNLTAHLRLVHSVFRCGLGLGVVGLSVSLGIRLLMKPVGPSFINFLANISWAVGAPALALFYTAAIVLLAQRDKWKRGLAPLAAVGRLALSNYLLESLLYVIIFHSYGLGLYGRVGYGAAAALTVPIFALQIFVSVWWLRRFRFGPAEWLWRTLTYGKLQPMRVSP